MAKEKARICVGCGEELQFNDPKALGYIPEEVYKRNNVELCRRCFRLQHYSEDHLEFMPSNTLTKILYDAKQKDAVFAYVVDLFNFEATFDREINETIKGAKVILLANKRDILCKSFNDNKIKEYIRKRASEAGLEAIDVLIISAKKNNHIDEVKNLFIKHASHKDVYVIGATSAGKSTLINKFLKNYTNYSSKPITTSCYPGTTTKLIRIPVTEDESIYDTPGIDSKHSIISILEKEVIKVITPKKEIKPITFQLNKGNMLMIGNLARIEYVDGPKTGVTIFVSADVDIHRGKIEKFDALKKELIDKGKLKPISNNINGYKIHTIEEKEEGKRDIIIAGLCWMSYNGNGQVFNVYAPKNITVANREAKFQG